jgi:hypothetical protein
LEYLEAVVRGEEPADTLRVAAARIVLPYQRPKQRAPVETPSPRKLRASGAAAINKDEHKDWEQRAAEVRRRLAAKEKT